MSWYRTLALLVALSLLGSCGFRPLYGSRDDGGVPAELATVDIDPIADRLGQQLRNHLFTLLNPRGRPTHPGYRLKVSLSESIQGLAVLKSSFATRANLRLTATFSLREIAGESNEPVLSGTSTLLSSYNILNSEFATLMARKDARSRAVREIAGDIANRLAIFVKRRQAGRTAGQ